MYASTDRGKTCNFVSHIIYGTGPETIQNGDRAIWEPFTMIYNGQMVICCSDQRDPKHSQKISYATSKDLKKWSVSQDVVSYPTQTDCPGMPIIAYVPSTGKYNMTYHIARRTATVLHTIGSRRTRSTSKTPPTMPCSHMVRTTARSTAVHTSSTIRLPVQQAEH